MEKKEEKRGFWASLFVPKPCGCCCGTQIEEVKEDESKQNETNKEESQNKSKPTCDCGGNC